MSREARHAPTITPESPQVPEKAQRSQRGCRSAEGSLEMTLSLGRYAHTSWLIMSRTIRVTRAHPWTTLSFNYYLQIRSGTPLYRVCPGKGSCDSFCAPATTNQDNIFFPHIRNVSFPVAKSKRPERSLAPAPAQPALATTVVSFLMNIHTGP